MILPNDWPGMLSAVGAFLVAEGGSLPAGTLGQVIAAQANPPIERLVDTAEALYAVADELGPAAWTLVGQVASFVSANFGHLSTDGEPDRGLRLLEAMRRRLGELDAAAAPPADDPVPLARFAAPA